jgi:glutathione synthase/RimK-type ligase-like ATP-grasp enzyme
MALKKYIFAGLDFVFDGDGEPWFIEANGSPRGMRSFELLFGGNTLSRKVADYMKRQGSETCTVISADDRFDRNKENGAWVYRKLKEHIPDIRLCYTHDNMDRRVNLVDSAGHVFRPDCIFRYGQKLAGTFERHVPMINPTVMRYIAMDKMLTAEIVRKRVRGANVPLAFLVRNTAQLRKRLQQNPPAFRDGYVIKPRYESLGFGIRVFASPGGKASVSRESILQQRIVPDLIGGKYWDVRVVLFDGKVAGGYRRVSRSMVTNVASGGKAEAAPPAVMKSVTKISEEIAKAIDDEAVRISNSEKLFRNLRRRTPKTVKNK